MNRSISLFCAALIIFISSPAFAWEARVVDVIDGDTITVEPISGGKRTKIRLHGIDAPESRQNFGQAAKAFVNKQVLFKEVDIQETMTDRYNRTVAIVNYDDTTLQERLIENGYAWVWVKYCKNCKDWLALEKKAVKAKKGLWQENKPVAPWIWRRKNK